LAGLKREFERLGHAAFAAAIASCTLCPQISAADNADKTPANESATEQTIEEIVVIGSRLRRRDFSSPSPIATVDRDTLYASGQATLETSLSQMPQFTPGFDRTANNPGNGRAYVDLRGLGPDRTLVMLNGRRLAPSGIGTAVDLNNLPQALIESVEVVTGGASAVYGSDAVSGVVNFTLRDHFEGFGLDTSAYTTEQGDSAIYDLNIAWGHNLAGGGNITLYGGYYDRDATYADARAFTAVPWIDSTFSGELFQGGSPRVPAGLLADPEVDFGNGPASTIFDPDGNPREFIDPDDYYNYAPANFLQIPLTRYNAGLFFHNELTPRTELYIEASYSHSNADRILAPVPAGTYLEINYDNPVLTPATRQLFADNLYPIDANTGLGFFLKRFEEFGPRIFENKSEYLRLLTGLRGDFGRDWYFDAWLTYTRNDEDDRLRNDGSNSRWQQGLLVDPVSGACFDPSGGCVPVDMFGTGRLSSEAIAFLRLPPLLNQTSRRQMLASAFLRGPVFETRAGPAEAAVGAEWRSDDGTFAADPYSFSGDSMTIGDDPDSPVDGEERVYEIYGELLVPLATEATFADYLALEIGGRLSEYKNAGRTTTYKGGIEWAPLPGLRFRGMFQRSMRAPNLLEAFAEQTVVDDFFVVDDPRDDPCSASSDPIANGNVDKCIATGLPADQVGVFEASQFPTRFISGGNPDLEPEQADTLTVGIVITPAAVADLQFSVDYFDIDIAGQIGPLAAVEACFDPANAENLFCDQIRRDPRNYNVNEVREFAINRGTFRTSGVDTQVSYALDLPDGLAIGSAGALFSANVVWTHLRRLSNQLTPFGSSFDCAGTFGWPCTEQSEGMTWPTDRVTARLRYDSGNLSAFLHWRWIGAADNGAYMGAPLIGIPVSDLDLAVPDVAAKNYLDVSVAYRFGEHVTAGLTIANLSDTGPPMMADWVWDKNTDSRMYDIFGRSYTLSLSLVY